MARWNASNFNSTRRDPGRRDPFSAVLDPGGSGKGTKQVDVLDVRGDDFQQYHLAEGGRFEIYVPAGVYTIRCLNHPGAEWTGLKSGSRDLKLEPNPVVLNEKTLGELFDRVWTAVDHSYSYFVVKKDVDWDAQTPLSPPGREIQGQGPVRFGAQGDAG